jgi:D-alanine-D-alanine ligase
MSFAKMQGDNWRIATERVKWNVGYQQRHGIDTAEAELVSGLAERIQHLAKRTYRALELSGYARIDFRMDAEGRPYVIEANPNPQLSRDEDFAQSARKAGLDYGELIQRIVNLGLRWQPAQLG